MVLKLNVKKINKIEGAYFECDICGKETNRGLEITTFNGDIYHIGNTCFKKYSK